jgi:hypothetical protein
MRRMILIVAMLVLADSAMPSHVLTRNFILTR